MKLNDVLARTMTPEQRAKFRELLQFEDVIVEAMVRLNRDNITFGRALSEAAAHCQKTLNEEQESFLLICLAKMQSSIARAREKDPRLS